jgi:ABC-type oligopeptide transport system ATPase subunit
MSTLMKFDQVSKLYRATSRAGGLTPALRKVSFELPPGEVISLIGESGSGKTTIGKILLRLVQPTSGTVTFGGKDIMKYSQRGLREYYRHVQGVFQDPFSSYNPIYRADRIFEMVRGPYFPGIGDTQWHDKIDAALDAVAINPGDVLGKYPHQLSGGQQQRLLIARALLLDVKVLVADEIISMLDASTRVDVLNLLVKLKRQGLAILFITHDLSLGNYVSDRTIILRRPRRSSATPSMTTRGCSCPRSPSCARNGSTRRSARSKSPPTATWRWPGKPKASLARSRRLPRLPTPSCWMS